VYRKTAIVSAALVAFAALAARLEVSVLAVSSQDYKIPSNPKVDRELEEKSVREANRKRDEEIKGDTQRLFQLATELKQAVDKTDENTLSLEVIRKAEELEKLAKRVKEKMKEGASRGPQPAPPPVPSPR